MLRLSIIVDTIILLSKYTKVVKGFQSVCSQKQQPNNADWPRAAVGTHSAYVITVAGPAKLRYLVQLSQTAVL